MSNDQLLRETGMRHITCITRERWLRLFGHVARFRDSDPAHQILFLRNSVERGRQGGRPQTSWLRQVDLDCRQLSTGLESGLPIGDLWNIAKRWTRLRAASAHAPTHDMTCI